MRQATEMTKNGTSCTATCARPPSPEASSRSALAYTYNYHDQIPYPTLGLEAIGNYMRQQVSIEGVFVSITKRTITPDLDIVHVYLGLLGSDNLNKAALLADMMRLHHWPVRS